MKLTSIPQIYRNANRWREILAVLSKHGLADWLARLDLPFAKRLRRGRSAKVRPTVSREERIVRAIEDLGPAFIKLGQVLATRADLVGVELAQELAKLQTAAPADPPELIRKTIEEELGTTIAEAFAEFDDQPVASASIGQVHRARLPDGRQVAVKVRHPGVEERLKVDADILVGLSELFERMPELAPYRPQALATEFQRTVRRELDFREELRRIDQFRLAFARDPRVKIPEPFPELSTKQVLTLEWLEGAKLSDQEGVNASGADRSEVAQHGAEVFLEMIFDHGLYHADPHPGNLLVLPGGVIGLLDFGMVGRISEALREDLEDVLIAVVADEPLELSAALLRIGSRPRLLDQEAFLADVTEFVDRYGRIDTDQFDLADALTELFRLVRRHKIVLTPQLALLLKLLVMLEGTARGLSPRFSLVSLLAPMQRRMMLSRLNPVRSAKKARRLYNEVEQLAEEMPQRVRDLLSPFQSGRFEIHLEHGGLEPSVNRLVLGLLTSSLIVAGALMVSNKVWPLYGASTPGLAAFALSGLLGARLVWAIRKSGWLDSH